LRGDAGKGEIQGFVLAGGRSSRMGQDKALVRFHGLPLLQRALDLFKEAGIAACVAGQHAPLEGYAAVVQDSISGRGPLGGICAALASMSAQRAIFLPVDMPLLPASVLTALGWDAEIAQRAVTALSVNGFAQTFPVVLDRAVLPTLERRLESDERGCFSAFQAAASSLGQPVRILAVESLKQAGRVDHPDGLPASRWFLNVNTPSELRWAEGLASREYRVI
jgi:molybdopterin-guanine dinucleotide biosynthesis protein A